MDAGNTGGYRPVTATTATASPKAGEAQVPQARTDVPAARAVAGAAAPGRLHRRRRHADDDRRGDDRHHADAEPRKSAPTPAPSFSSGPGIATVMVDSLISIEAAEDATDGPTVPVTTLRAYHREIARDAAPPRARVEKII